MHNVGTTVADDIEKVMTDNIENVTPFMKFFWEQQ